MALGLAQLRFCPTDFATLLTTTTLVLRRLLRSKRPRRTFQWGMIEGYRTQTRCPSLNNALPRGEIFERRVDLYPELRGRQLPYRDNATFGRGARERARAGSDRRLYV